jgi:Leucine-rich repeat (LRR) protein
MHVLSHLESLRLTGNTYIAGGSELPLLANIAQVSKLSNLRQLDLSNNRLYGSIPSRYFDLTNLTELNLYNNDFSGKVDRGLGELLQLRVLNLGENNLDGTIKLDTLTNLEHLILDGFNDGGLVDVQTQILPMTKLKELSLKSVDTFQPFLSDLSVLSNLEVLDLEDTDLEGSIGTSFSALTSLRTLSVKRNFLSGAIVSDSFEPLINLEYLDLSDNSFVGTLPEFPSSLTELHIYDNGFSGPVDFLCQPTTTTATTMLQIELDCDGGGELDSSCSCCVCHV